jgi:hypothetical protein
MIKYVLSAVICAVIFIVIMLVLTFTLSLCSLLHDLMTVDFYFWLEDFIDNHFGRK